MDDSVYIGLGSNLGDRMKNLRTAAERIGESESVIAASRVYESPPWGNEAQPMFLNAAIKIGTERDPHGLLSSLLDIEDDMGRKRDAPFGPRTIDIDILLYKDLILKSKNLRIPHPRMKFRAFVLGPLCDIDPDKEHPESQKTMKDMLGEVGSSGLNYFGRLLV